MLWHKLLKARQDSHANVSAKDLQGLIGNDWMDHLASQELPQKELHQHHRLNPAHQGSGIQQGIQIASADSLRHPVPTIGKVVWSRHASTSHPHQGQILHAI